MAEPQPPVALAARHQLVYNNNRESVFCVRTRMKLQCYDQVREFLVETNPDKNEDEIEDLMARNSRTGSTGFAVAQHGDLGYIASCSHPLQDFYSRESPLLEEHIDWFNFCVLCIHNEEELADTLPGLYDMTTDPRQYSQAVCVLVDSTKDLMLLQINMGLLYANRDLNLCTEEHPPLTLALNVPPQLEDVVMISWPPLLHNTVVIGEVMHQRRRYRQLSSLEEEKGYTMDLVECNMIGHDGCSGSPVLNLEGEVIGLYHGRLNDKGYSVSLDDLREFLEFYF